MKVYIPHLPTRYDRATESRVPSIDINPARQYGEFVRLLDPEKNVHAGMLADAIEEVGDNMADFNEEDAILAVGDVVLIAAAIAKANDIHGSCRVLRWDRTSKSYDLIEVCL